jgi:hypothetical protein
MALFELRWTNPLVRRVRNQQRGWFIGRLPPGLSTASDDHFIQQSADNDNPLLAPPEADDGQTPISRFIVRRLTTNAKILSRFLNR